MPRDREMDEICGNINLESNKQADEDVVLPGFRFYPTDEELIDFYLRRKVEKKPISIELIKEIDIYKYDPWDLHKVSSTVGDNEWYFYCKRERKYRNSVRPNRVTGSGFWKATGIDKPVYANAGDGERRHGRVVGLKKSLVYYRGSAGKGTKTDWMMHEFRLPPELSSSVITVQEAEVWTLCRIFIRTVPNRKYTANWREISTKSRNHPAESTSGSSGNNHMLLNMSKCSEDSYYISFKPDTTVSWTDKRPLVGNIDGTTPSSFSVSRSSLVSHSAPFMAASSSTSSFSYPDGYNNNNQFFANDQSSSWDELRPVMDQFAVDASRPPP